MRSCGFPRLFRLRKRREFLVTQRRGRKHHTRFFLVFVLPIAADKSLRAPLRRAAGAAPSVVLPATRLGITVTRKIGKAVLRNRIKRLVREAFRRKRVSFPPGFAMVWVAKRASGEMNFDDALAAMDILTRQMSARKRGKRGGSR